MAMLTPKPQITATCQSPCSAPVRTAQATEPVPNRTIRKVPSASPTRAPVNAGAGEALLLKGCLAEQLLDDDAVAPGTVELAVSAVDADFGEADLARESET